MVMMKEVGNMLSRNKIFSILIAVAFIVATALSVPTFAAGALNDDGNKTAKKNARVEAPLNLAVLVQDDLVSRVGSELAVTRDFIRTLPDGSRVMVGYITMGSLQVRQSFTNDLDKASKALRIPRSSESASPYNPYVEVIEALRSFPKDGKGRNAVLLISDGLDTSHGFDVTSAANTVDLQRAIRLAKERNVAVYSFYAPTVGLTSWNHTAINYGQSSLNRISNETGGRAFFQGTDFVTFDAYFERLRQTLNEQYARAY